MDNPFRNFSLTIRTVKVQACQTSIKPILPIETRTEADLI